METFHKTVRGHLHIMRELPCEDASLSFSADENYHIAIIADGHGSEQCFRSKIGSKIAVEAAFDCLKKFAETILSSKDTETRFYQDIFTNPRYCRMALRQLTDTIIAEWNDRVLEDYAKNPPSLEELEETSYDASAMTDHIAVIYGTTLLVALMLPSCLLLLHQGDGRCDVFFDDGTVEQPIPWDSRCEDTATTSLCDKDVAESIRTCVLNLEEKKVIACYLGCDGVEDAYRDTYEGLGGSHALMGGVHTFYKDLTCQFAEKSKEEFEEYLNAMLPKFSEEGRFSRSGSGDDVSIAGIVDREAVWQFIKSFQLDVKQYALEEELFWKEDELRGKTRKHGILLKRSKEAQAAVEKAVKEQNAWKAQLEQLQKKREELEEKAAQAKKELEEYHNDSKDVMEYFDETKETASADGDNMMKKLMKIGVQTVKFLYDEVSMGCQKREREYNRLCKELQDCDAEILVMEENYSNSSEYVTILEKNAKEAEAAFAEYDAKYQAVYNEKNRILDEINKSINQSIY